MDAATGVEEIALNGLIEESGKGAQRSFHRANGRKLGSTCVALFVTQLLSFPSSASALECELGDEAVPEIALSELLHDVWTDFRVISATACTC